MKTVLSCARAVLVLLAAQAHAATLDVPGQFPTLQAAINAAQTNDIVVVHGGVHPPIKITRSITIVGDPLATIDNTPTPATTFFVEPTIDCQGSGSSYVRLVRIKTTGQVDGNSVYTHSNAGISATGLSQLLVEDCDIHPPEWFQLTGVAPGAAGISTSAPYVRIVRSIVRGGRSDTDACDYSSCPDSLPGVDAPSSTVVVIDSDVRGGIGGLMCFSAGNCPGPCPCPAIGAAGGPGIVAQRLFFGGPSNVIAGGLGQPVYCGFATIGSQPNGSDWIVSGPTIDLGKKLTGNGALEIGKTMTLSVNAGSANTTLLVGSPTQPLFAGGPYGWLFLMPNSMLVIPFPFLQQLSLAVPQDSSLVGVEVAIQVYDPAFKLSSPYFSAIEP